MYLSKILYKKFNTSPLVLKASYQINNRIFAVFLSVCQYKKMSISIHNVHSIKNFNVKEHQ